MAGFNRGAALSNPRLKNTPILQLKLASVADASSRALAFQSAPRLFEPQPIPHASAHRRSRAARAPAARPVSAHSPDTEQSLADRDTQGCAHDRSPAGNN